MNNNSQHTMQQRTGRWGKWTQPILVCAVLGILLAAHSGCRSRGDEETTTELEATIAKPVRRLSAEKQAAIEKEILAEIAEVAKLGIVYEAAGEEAIAAIEAFYRVITGRNKNSRMTAVEGRMLRKLLLKYLAYATAHKELGVALSTCMPKIFEEGLDNERRKRLLEQLMDATPSIAVIHAKVTKAMDRFANKSKEAKKIRD